MADLDEIGASAESDGTLLGVTSRAVRLLRQSPRWEQCASKILAEFGSVTSASRCYLLRICRPDELTVTLNQQAEWSAWSPLSTESAFNGLCISADEFVDPEWRQQVASGAMLAELNGCPGALLDLFHARHVRSLAMLSIQVHGDEWGLLGLEDCVNHRRWTSEEIDALNLIADAFGSAIQWQSREGQDVRAWAIVENSEDAIISKRLDGTVTDWNPAAERIYGYTREEMVGGSITRIIPAELQHEFHEIMRRLRAGQRIEHHETVRVRKDGNRVAISLSISPVRNDDGAVTGAVTIARDITERRQAELALQTSEERLRLALEAGDIGAWDWDIRTGEVVWSPNMERLHGLEPGSFDGTFEAYRRSIHPDDYERVTGALNRALDGEDEYQLEYLSLRSNETYQWLSAQGTVIRDFANRAVRMTGVCYDVTEQKRAEAARNELLAQLQRARAETDSENARLREMFQHAPAMMALLEGPEHVFVLANDHYLRTIGHRDVLGKPIIEALPEVADQGIVDLLDQVYRSGETVTRSELPVLIDSKGDGRLEELYFSFAYQPFRGPSGDVTGVLVHAVDLTEHVHARQRVEQLVRAVASERDRLQQVIDVMPEGVSITDERGAFVLVNSAALSIWGQPAPSGDYCQYTAFECYFPDGTLYAPEELPLARSILAGEEILGEQLTIRNVERGDLIPVLVNSVPLRNGDGVITGAVAVFQDISGLKEFERQKDEFLQSVTHDLRNPLTTILGNIQLLQRTGSPDPERIEMLLANMESASNRAIALIDEILDLTRLQMGRSLEMSNTTVDLVDLVRRLAEQHQALTSEHEIVVQAEVAELTGECDEVRLERVIANLISNAIIYSPDGGTVTVRIDREATDEGPCAVISIEDEGLGIPEHEIPLLFQRFWRGSNVRDAVRGTGLGLAGAKAIAEAHGGSITVESVEGQGSTFTVRLPCNQSALTGV